MRYQTKLLVTVGLLLTLSLTAAALAYWSVERSLYALERSRIASRHLESYLELSRQIHEAILHSAVALAEGDADRAIALAPPNASAKNVLRRARDLVRKEIAVVGEKEKPFERVELKHLAQIELQIDELGESIRDAVRERIEADSGANGIGTTKILADPSATMAAQIDAAIAEEERQVVETDRAARRLFDRLSGATKLIALLAALATAGCLLLLLQGLRRPLADLMTGTQALWRAEIFRIASDCPDRTNSPYSPKASTTWPTICNRNGKS